MRIAQAAQLRPEWLIVPMARGVDSEVASATDWSARERFVYVERARTAAAPLLLINQLTPPDAAEPYFGGALAVDCAGTIVAELPLEQPGILYVDTDEI